MLHTFQSGVRIYLRKGVGMYYPVSRGPRVVKKLKEAGGDENGDEDGIGVKDSDGQERW